MTLTPEGYRPRLLDKIIPTYLEAFGALEIKGPKWCGKTWTSLHHANSAYYIADPSNNYANRTRAQLDATGVLAGAEPRVLDEWPEAPAIWDAVRQEVDRGKSRGRFILTGSATPQDLTTTHSGTGRVARLTLRPMTLFESGDSSGEVALGDLAQQADIPPASSHLTLDTLIELVIRGGWPESVGASFQAARLLPEQYLLSVSQSDISRIDNIKRDPEKVMALLRSLARTDCGIVSYATYAADIAHYNSGEMITEQSIASYLKLLRRLFVIEDVPGWAPALRSPVRLRSNPKRYFVDPSLAAAGLRADATTLREDTKTLGFLFENLVMRDLLVYAEHNQAEVSYYLDNSQLDADVILSYPGEQWAAIEIKLGSNKEDAGAAKLLRLQKKLVARDAKPPRFLAVITGIGTTAHRRDDGVYCVPIDCLKP